MSAKQEEDEKGLILRVPRILELRDLITIVSVAVSLTMAWGVFSTRITVVERELLALHEKQSSMAASIEALQVQQARLGSAQQDDELLIDQLYLSQGKSVPTRRGASVTR